MEKCSVENSALQTIDVGGWRLRVEFTRQCDRYSHQILLVGAGESFLLLESVEGGNLAAWPDSPPLQDLNFQRQDRSSVALLLGMAGASHWSLSVEAPAATAEIIFDVACRSSASHQRLASSYRPVGLNPTTAMESGVAWDTPAGAVSLLAEAVGDNGIARIESTEEGVAIVADTKNADGPATIRWKYRLTLQS